MEFVKAFDVAKCAGLRINHLYQLSDGQWRCNWRLEAPDPRNTFFSKFVTHADAATAIRESLELARAGAPVAAAWEPPPIEAPPWLK